MKLISFVLVVLSTAGASAQSIWDIGLLVLVNDGASSKSLTCTTSEFDRLAADLNGKARAFDDGYLGGRRELQETESGLINVPMDNHGSSRRLPSYNCRTVCQGFVPGSCTLVYPACTGYRRELEEDESKVDATITLTQNLRGSERQLLATSPYVLPNGFMSDVGGAQFANAKAIRMCAEMKAGLTTQVVSLPNRQNLTSPCDSLWRSTNIKVGCVFMPALP